MSYRLCVYASGSLIADIFRFRTESVFHVCIWGKTVENFQEPYLLGFSISFYFHIRSIEPNLLLVWLTSFLNSLRYNGFPVLVDQRANPSAGSKFKIATSRKVIMGNTAAFTKGRTALIM